jgi:hypothetical protein
MNRRSFFAAFAGLLVATSAAVAGDTEPDGRYARPIRWRRKRPLPRRMRIRRRDGRPVRIVVDEVETYVRVPVIVEKETVKEVIVEKPVDKPLDCEEIKDLVRALSPDRLEKRITASSREQRRLFFDCIRRQ